MFFIPTFFNYRAVGFVFIFSSLLMLLTIIIFIVGTPMHRFVCEPLTDPDLTDMETVINEKFCQISSEILWAINLIDFLHMYLFLYTNWQIIGTNEILEAPLYSSTAYCDFEIRFLYPRSSKGEGGILFYLCPSFRPSKIFFVAFFSVTVDGRNLIFGHKHHIGIPYCG